MRQALKNLRINEGITTKLRVHNYFKIMICYKTLIFKGILSFIKDVYIKQNVMNSIYKANIMHDNIYYVIIENKLKY